MKPASLPIKPRQHRASPQDMLPETIICPLKTLKQARISRSDVEFNPDNTEALESKNATAKQYTFKKTV
jgi:hypothetical protein